MSDCRSEGVSCGLFSTQHLSVHPLGMGNTTSHSPESSRSVGLGAVRLVPVVLVVLNAGYEVLRSLVIFRKRGFNTVIREDNISSL